MNLKSQRQIYAASEKVLLPLVRLMLHWGIAAGEFNDLSKRAYVRAASEGARQQGRRVTYSRIAVLTGLTRAEVKRLLEHRAGRMRYPWQHDRATRVVQGWLQDDEFRLPTGQPRPLPLLGKRRSFSSLVRRFSGDIPPRAMLNVLLEKGIVRRSAAGAVILRKASYRGPRGVAGMDAFGSRAGVYLRTLLHNLESNDSRYDSSVSVAAVDENYLPVLKRMIKSRADTFLSSAGEQLRARARRRGSRGSSRMTRFGITVFTFEE